MKKLIIVFVIFHFAVIIAHNVASIGNGIQVIYGNGQPTEENYSVLAGLNKIIHYLPIHYYSRYSGTETGFAFFAPQVGSQYISEFLIYDEDGNLLTTLNQPALSQSESLLRYGAFLDLFQELIADEKTEDHFDRRYARAILYSLSERIGKEIPNAHRVDYSLSIYHYPTLQKFVNHTSSVKPEPSLINIFENSILLEGYE